VSRAKRILEAVNCDFTDFNNIPIYHLSGDDIVKGAPADDADSKNMKPKLNTKYIRPKNNKYRYTLPK